MRGVVRSVWRPVAASILICAVAATSGCVRWQSVPPADLSAQPSLPRWVRVTTRDSTHLLMEHAEFRGDTLVGRASDDAAAPLARIPMVDVAHLEARAPSPIGSVGVAAILLGAVAAFAFLVGHAAGT